MKILFSMALAFLAFGANAQDMKLKDYDWTLTDIARKGYNKDDLFENMDTKFVRPKSSICSNRAHMWAQDFKARNGLDTGKIFLFYTKKKSSVGSKTWWYHVAPIVNENQKLWVMDPGFPGFVDEALSITDWAKTFTDSTNCKEIRATDTDLIERMFITQVFPQYTSHGYHECYYMVAPHTIWTPESLAMSLSGKNDKGEPVHFSRPRIDKDEYYQACVEATTSKIGFAFGGKKDKCKSLANRLDW
ncbi:MAG TPA: protein-glutamine glutaminase family protein [Bacteriovoracaceae bacterium]|nr:protein-glutamine glutaminase family protein [Bacteriovoracaceae bacterium]